MIDKLTGKKKFHCSNKCTVADVRCNFNTLQLSVYLLLPNNRYGFIFHGCFSKINKPKIILFKYHFNSFRLHKHTFFRHLPYFKMSVMSLCGCFVLIQKPCCLSVILPFRVGDSLRVRVCVYRYHPHTELLLVE